VVDHGLLVSIEHFVPHGSSERIGVTLTPRAQSRQTAQNVLRFCPRSFVGQGVSSSDFLRSRVDDDIAG
jgi:hypothetical protein